MLIFILIIGIIIFILCKSNEQNLGDDYFYLPKYEAIDIGYKGGGIVYKSKEKYFFHDIKISGNVAEAKANKDFIIALQNKDTSYIKSLNYGTMNSNLYFIIRKKSEEIYEPYNKEEYLLKREELKVPKSLK